jgi:hypothetical protein
MRTALARGWTLCVDPRQPTVTSRNELMAPSECSFVAVLACWRALNDECAARVWRLVRG